MNEANPKSVNHATEPRYSAAIQSVALVDRSTIGRIIVTGADRLDLLHRLSTNNLIIGREGQCISTVFTTDKGRVIDCVCVIVQPSSLLLLTSPLNDEKLSAWIDKYTIMEDIHLAVVTHATLMFTLAGPKAKESAEMLLGISLETNRAVQLKLFSEDVDVIYRTEFQTDFVDFVGDAKLRSVLEAQLRRLVRRFDGQELDTESFELFRIATGIPAFGAEISEAYNPYEAGLQHMISFTKGCYIGQEIIARLDTYNKIQRIMVGIVLESKTGDVSGKAPIFFNGEEVGNLTSVSMLAVQDKHLGIGIVKKNSVRADDHVSIVCDGTWMQGTVRLFPIVL